MQSSPVPTFTVVWSVHLTSDTFITIFRVLLFTHTLGEVQVEYFCMELTR